MPVNIYKRQNDAADALTSLTQGFLQGQELRRKRQQDEMNNLLTAAKIEEAQRKAEALATPAPEGYFRDSYTGKLHKTLPSASLMPGMGGSNLTPTKYDAYGRPKEYQDFEAALERKINEKDLMEQAKNLPKLDQALQASQQLQSLYGNATKPRSVMPGDIRGGLEARMAGIPQSASALFGANPNLRQYSNQRKAFSGLLAKGGFGEAGMLTQQDIQRITSILPDEYSTKEEADLAWNEISSILGSARQRFENKKSELIGGSKRSVMPSGKKSGGQVMTDANGNRAMVYPDGSYEEI